MVVTRDISMRALDSLSDKRDRALSGGGAERHTKQREKGKLSARERVSVLLDAGCDFSETDMLVEHRCANFNMQSGVIVGDGAVTGYGQVNGRLACVASQDFTVYGGSLGEMHAKKICKLMDVAADSGVPFVSINDSGGARIRKA